MLLKEAIQLIQVDEIQNPALKAWADLGCGSGLFTRALSELLVLPATIYAVDRSISLLDPGPHSKRLSIHPIQADFVTDPLPLKNLDGVLMANSLHFVSDKKLFLKRTRAWFKINPLFLIIEYDTDIANRWVPYPLPFRQLKDLFEEQTTPVIRKIGVKKSLYNNADLYSALIYYSPA